MSHDPRLPAIRRLLFNFVRSPSLRHLRDPHSIEGLAEDIVRSLGEDRPTWRKWDKTREEFLKSAAHCWIPVDDLRDYLNGMPGPKLTNTDVAQRLQVHYVEPYVSFPDEDLQAGCLVIYEREKAEGTELPAIVGALQEHIEKEENRLRIEQQAAREKYIEDERIASEQRFLSGADCKWTPIERSKEQYCRINGRSYRLSPTADKMWNLHRIKSVEDSEGRLIGKYQHRKDVTKALSQVAYQPEQDW